MVLGKVIGSVVAERKSPGLEGKALLIVQPQEANGRLVGGPVVAVDTVLAGPGDYVYLAQSREAALALDPWFVPVDHAIVAIVDDVNLEED